ncbi:hypothetical protein [Pararhizobium sp. A13]
MADYLHRHSEFANLLRIVGDEMGTLPPSPSLETLILSKVWL